MRWPRGATHSKISAEFAVGDRTACGGTLTLRALIGIVLVARYVWRLALGTLRTALRWIAIGAVVLGAGSSATAQQQPTPALAPPGPQVNFEGRPRLSPQDELVQAD